MRRLKQTKIWFLSYAFTFLICIVMSAIVTRVSEHILSRQIEETMSIAFESSINTIENRIENQQINMFAVLESSGVVTLSNKYLKPDRGTELELVRQIMDSMIVQYANSECTDDNLICFRDIDLVVGMRDSFDRAQAYKQWFSDVYSSEEDWHKDLFSVNNMAKFRPFRDSRGRQKFLIIQKRLKSIGAEPDVVAVSFIDAERLFGEMYEDPLCKTFILSDGRQLCSSNDESKYEDITENGAIVSFENEEYTQYGKEQNWLYFIQLFNNGDYTKRLSIVSRIGIVINICVFIIGIFISMFFTKINYLPLRRVTSRLKLDVSGENEFIAIEKGIENILQDRKNISRQLKKNDERLYEAYNKMLINASSKEDAKLIAENLSMRFKYKNFVIAAFRIDDIGNVSSDSDTHKENIEIATFCIINVYRELLPENVVCDFCIIDNVCYCILNFSHLSLMEKIHETAGRVCDFLKDNLDMKIVYLVSGNGELADMPELREQVERLSSFAGIIDSKGFCFDKYSVYLNEIYRKYYLGDLINAVDNGDSAETVTIINGFINRVMNDKYAVSDYKNIFQTTFLGSYKEMCTGDKLHNYHNAEKVIETDNDIKNVKSAILKLYKSLAMHKKSVDSGSDEKICAIIEFIEENYSDENLNVSFVSEKMNMSISQLSRYFKNNTNEGLADYILRYRCKKAAELLNSQPEITVAEVGKRCGFMNSISFIRAFKRVYDITPGKYNPKRGESDD